MYKVRNARNSLCSSTQFRLSTADEAKVAQLSETGQYYSLWSQELQFTFVNCLQIIHKFKHEQCVGIRSCTSSKVFALVCLYRSPQVGPTTEFFTDLTNLITLLKQQFKHIVITGDLNTHLDTTTELPAMHAFDLFLINDRYQYVQKSTHRQGHLLDVVLTNAHCSVARLSVHRPRS